MKSKVITVSSTEEENSEEEVEFESFKVAINHAIDTIVYGKEEPIVEETKAEFRVEETIDH